MTLTTYPTWHAFETALAPYLETQPDLNPRLLIALPDGEGHHFLSLKTVASTPFFCLATTKGSWVVGGGAPDQAGVFANAVAMLPAPANLMTSEDMAPALLAAMALEPRITMTLPLVWYRLAKLIPVENVRGQCRAATEADRDLFLEHQAECISEALNIKMRRDEQNDFFTKSLDKSGVLFWEVDGRVTSHLVLLKDGPGLARIGSVYTPPALRGLGYGKALTAAACTHILEKGKVPCLNADARLPHTNRMYEGLGFVARGRFCHYGFA